MSNPLSYEPVLSSKATDFLVSLSKGRQRKLIKLLFQLAESPNQIGDYAIQDDTAREIQVLIVGDLSIAFWADHPAKELRIVTLEEI